MKQKPPAPMFLAKLNKENCNYGNSRNIKMFLKLNYKIIKFGRIFFSKIIKFFKRILLFFQNVVHPFYI